MNWRINVLVLVLVSFTCQKEKVENIDKIEANYLVEAKDLKAIINLEHIKVLDFRKKEVYSKEHIVGALNIWRTDIEDASYPYKGIMASKTQIEALFGKLGIKTTDTIIVYDDNALCEASRLWWILQNYEFKNIKMLDGGISEWKSNHGEVTSEITKVNPTLFKLTKNPKMQYYVSKQQVTEALNTNIVLLDTRTIDEFTGKRQKKGAAKSGRLPSSMHIDWAENVNYHGNQRLKSIEDLEIIYSKLNINKKDSIILYCHSGVRSAHTTFVLTQLLGYENVVNYDGSWTEWSYFNELPVESDSITQIKK